MLSGSLKAEKGGMKFYSASMRFEDAKETSPDAFPRITSKESKWIVTWVCQALIRTRLPVMRLISGVDVPHLRLEGSSVDIQYLPLH
jgi:hypothetical protein